MFQDKMCLVSDGLYENKKDEIVYVHLFKASGLALEHTEIEYEEERFAGDDGIEHYIKIYKDIDMSSNIIRDGCVGYILTKSLSYDYDRELRPLIKFYSINIINKS